MCGEVLQAEGEAYAEFTWLSGTVMVGVARAGVDPSSVDGRVGRGGLHETAGGWMCYYDGRHFHNGRARAWVSGGKEGMRAGEPFGLLLRRGSLSVHIKGRQVGVMCTGLSGALVWVADLQYRGASVRIARKPPPAA